MGNPYAIPLAALEGTQNNLRYIGQDIANQNRSTAQFGLAKAKMGYEAEAAKTNMAYKNKQLEILKAKNPIMPLREIINIAFGTDAATKLNTALGDKADMDVSAFDAINTISKLKSSATSGQPKEGTTRKIQQGDQIITQEYRNGAWSQIGKGPKFKSGSEEGGFTLGPGQTRYSKSGKVVAKGPEKDTALSEDKIRKRLSQLDTVKRRMETSGGYDPVVFTMLAQNNPELAKKIQQNPKDAMKHIDDEIKFLESKLPGGGTSGTGAPSWKDYLK